MSQQVTLSQSEAEQIMYALCYCKKRDAYDLFGRLESIYFPDGWDDSRYNYSQLVELDLENMFLEDVK